VFSSIWETFWHTGIFTGMAVWYRYGIGRYRPSNHTDEELWFTGDPQFGERSRKREKLDC